MSKFLHADAGFEAGTSADRLGIKWPALPWRCPVCDVMYRSHATTVATLDATRYEHPEEATFLCMLCDLRVDVVERQAHGPAHHEWHLRELVCKECRKCWPHGASEQHAPTCSHANDEWECVTEPEQRPSLQKIAEARGIKSVSDLLDLPAFREAIGRGRKDES